MRINLPNGAGKVGIVILVLIVIGCLHVLYQSPTNNVTMAKVSPVITTITQGKDSLDWKLQATHFKSKKEARLKAIRESGESNQLAGLQMYVIPQMVCPTMVRVGKVGDGGKWICNPWRVPHNCIVYSLGVNGDVSFESDIFEITNRQCKIYSVDAGDQPAKLFKPFNGIFLQMNVSGKANPADNRTSLSDLMQRYNHKKVDIIKMDIETWEFDTLTGYFNLANTNQTQSTFCQLLVEFHFFTGKLTTWVNLFEELEKRGFRMFSKEANMYCTSCYEYSFIHITCFEQYGLPKSSTFATFFV